MALDTGRRTPNLQSGQCLVQSETKAIGVFLVPEAKHQTILKKFCSVPFFDDHLHLMKYNMAAVNKRSNLFLFCREMKSKKELYRMVLSVSLSVCLCLCLSVCLSVFVSLSVCLSVSQSVSLSVSQSVRRRAEGRQYVP